MDQPDQEWNGEGVPPFYRLTDRQRQKYRGGRPWDRWYIQKHDDGALAEMANLEPQVNARDVRGDMGALSFMNRRLSKIDRRFYSWDPHVKLHEWLKGVNFLRTDPSKAGVIRMMMNNATTREMQNRTLWMGFMCAMYLNSMAAEARLFAADATTTPAQIATVSRRRVTLVQLLSVPRVIDSADALTQWRDEIVVIMESIDSMWDHLI